jgi:hypothetical protein
VRRHGLALRGRKFFSQQPAELFGGRAVVHEWGPKIRRKVPDTFAFPGRVVTKAS